ncbi:unnamed protein product [Amoebophrya sp. A25]|nr:unnamed protein product [Amoebophrya sp. A25]|eukprot:GSA25T00003279001.1
MVLKSAVLENNKPTCRTKLAREANRYGAPAFRREDLLALAAEKGQELGEDLEGFLGGSQTEGAKSSPKTICFADSTGGVPLLDFDTSPQSSGLGLKHAEVFKQLLLQGDENVRILVQRSSFGDPRGREDWKSNLITEGKLEEDMVHNKIHAIGSAEYAFLFPRCSFVAHGFGAMSSFWAAHAGVPEGWWVPQQPQPDKRIWFARHREMVAQMRRAKKQGTAGGASAGDEPPPAPGGSSPVVVEDEEHDLQPLEINFSSNETPDEETIAKRILKQMSDSTAQDIAREIKTAVDHENFEGGDDKKAPLGPQAVAKELLQKALEVDVQSSLRH